MAGLDLTGVRSFMETILDDTLEITRDGGAADDTLNLETGQLTDTPGVGVYSGPGKVQPVNTGGTDLPGVDVAVVARDSNTTHRALLPLGGAEAILMGDRLKVTDIAEKSADPTLLDREYIVTEVPDSSGFAVVRIVWLRTVPITAPEGP